MRVSATQARQLFLQGQGLLADPTKRVTLTGLYRLIEHMGFVQMDSINTVERAHHLTLGSRLDGYRPPMLARLLEERRALFEHWTHDAAAIPSCWFPHWRHRFERDRQRIEASAWWRQRMGPDLTRVMRQVEARVVAEGPLRAQDFEAEASEKHEPGGWWNWKPEKAALEHLWRTGRLAIAGRVHFQKVYDLCERVLPEPFAAPVPEHDAHVDWACRTAFDRLGTATPAELASFWHAIDLATARAWCVARASAGELLEVEVESSDGSRPRRAYAPVDWRTRARACGPAPDRLRFLSPFDPILRDRKRCQRLFDFDYRFEAFVPAKKRRYGYYVLPILERDRLIGRADAKMIREEGLLALRAIWWEPGVRANKARKRALADALERLARLTGAERTKLPR